MYKTALHINSSKYQNIKGDITQHYIA